MTDLPAFTAASRNLVRFARHADHETMHGDFAADFAFRDLGSRVSIMKSPHSLPGPDLCHAWYDIDGRALFTQLLGLELSYPGQSPAAMRHMSPYTSHNYYRSHIDEYFVHTGAHPLPPVEGECRMFMAAPDRLRVHYTVRNRSVTDVAIRLRWISQPAPGLVGSRETRAGAACLHARQRVRIDYTVDVRLHADFPGASFSLVKAQDASPTSDGGGDYFATAGLDVTLPPLGEWTGSFTVDVDYPDSRAVSAGSHAPASADRDLAAAIADHEAAYARLPALPPANAGYRRLALKATGILRSLRNLDVTPDGTPVTTIHAGKCGVAATWFWDSAFGFLGLSLIGELEPIRGATRILLGTLTPDGRPMTRYNRGEFATGAQQPVLAWSLANVLARHPDAAFVAEIYPALARYVTWWLGFAAPAGAGDGLVSYAPGGVCWDDTLRWQDHHPIAPRPGDTWHTAKWGRMVAPEFQNVDTNTHLYLECRALALFARTLDMADEAVAWEARAEVLRVAINTHLYDAASGCYMDRDRRTGAFTGMLTPSCFLPLYAGIAPPDVARRLAETLLLDPARFYTLLPFPTLDRAHPAFRAGGHLFAPPEFPGSLVQHAYWIGRTWPHMSYLMVGALHRAGLPDAADAAAERLLDAFDRQESLYECYDSLTAYPNGHAEFLWSSAATLALLHRQYRDAPIPATLG